MAAHLLRTFIDHSSSWLDQLHGKQIDQLMSSPSFKRMASAVVDPEHLQCAMLAVTGVPKLEKYGIPDFMYSQATL